MTALGASTGLGMTVVWLLGVGRDIDAFHGIAQTTSTASVGFEGYLAWAAAAAIVGPVTLQRAWRKPLDADVWWAALRKCLVLIAVWCAGSGVLRIFDLIVAVSLDQPFSAYDSVALLAFDVLAAVLAVWLSVNLKNPSLHPVVLTAVCGVLFVQTICRVVVGVGLAPRILYVDAPADLDDAVYGNTLAHQITSTFDVVLCWLALLVTVAALLVGQFGGVLRKPTQSAKPVAAQAQPNQRPQLPTGAMPGGAQDAVTSQVWQRGGTTTAPPPGPPPPAPAAAPAPARPVPRIARPGQPATADAPPPADATQSGSAEQPRIARINQPPAPPGP